MSTHRFNVKSGGRYLKKLRQLSNLSQPELAKKLKISRPYLVNLERGNRSIGTWTILTRICNHFQIPPMTLVHWYYPKSQP